MTQNYGVYRKQGATELVIDSGGTLNAASGKIILPTVMRKGVIPLDIFSARILSSGEAFFDASASATGTAVVFGGGTVAGGIGGLITANTIPNLAMNSTLNRMPHVNWASGQTQALAFPTIPIPVDLNTASALTINAWAERTSDNVTNNTLDLRYWVNANTTEMGTTGSTISSTPGLLSVSVGATALAAYPGVMAVQIVPGTHTNNAVRVYGAWIEYARLTS